MEFLGEQGGDQYDDGSQGFQQPQVPMGYGQLPQRFNSDFAKYQYEVGDVLSEIENWLRGNIRNQDGLWENKFTPLIAEEGVNLLMGDLRSHLHKVVFLSNLGEEQVRRMAREMRIMVAAWIYSSHHKYKIARSNWNRIIYNLDHSILCALMKPMNDKERIHLSETTSRSENIQVLEQSQRKKWGIF